jgi:hypothetical protein
MLATVASAARSVMPTTLRALPRLRRSPRALAALALFLVALRSPTASGAGPAPDVTQVPLFSIAKSENKNQIQYVVTIDARCAPVGAAPVSAYWRMLEKGPTLTAPLLPREARAYGLARQDVLESDPNGGHVRIALRALARRPLDIVTFRGADGACRALTTTSIGGAPSHLFNVYVHLQWDGVDYLLLQGWSIDGARVLREKVTGAT